MNQLILKHSDKNNRLIKQLFGECLGTDTIYGINSYISGDKYIN